MTKKITAFFFPLLAIAILAGCGGNNAGKDNFILRGKLTNAKQDSIYLQELTVKGEVGVDSLVVSEDGEFQFNIKPKDVAFYILKLDHNNFITLLIDKGETVEVIADSRQLLKTYSVTGSKGSELIKECNARTEMNYNRVDSLGKVYENAKNNSNPDILKVKAKLDSVYLTIFNDQKTFLKNIIDKNTTSLACLIAIYQQFGRTPLFSFNNKEDFAYFEKLDKAYMATYPENPHTKDLHERISKVKRIQAEQELAEGKLAIGAVAPDFTLETPEGKSVSLSSLKGKTVVIDFWASWCAPCRAENPGMVKLYNKYKDKDFTIIGVSLDRDKDAWTAAIKKDKLSWTQVSDLKYWSSPVVKLYNIQAIPHSIVIDKEGKIMAKGLRGDSLAMKVAELVK